MMPFNYQDQSSFQNTRIDMARPGQLLPDGRRFIDIIYDGLSFSVDKFSFNVPVTVVLNGTDPFGPNVKVLLPGDSLVGRFSQARVIYPSIGQYPNGLINITASKTSFINNTTTGACGVLLDGGQVTVNAGAVNSSATYMPISRVLITDVVITPANDFAYTAGQYTHVNVRSGKTFNAGAALSTFDITPVLVSVGVFKSYPQNYFCQRIIPMTVEAGEGFNIIMELTDVMTTGAQVDYSILGHVL